MSEIDPYLEFVQWVKESRSKYENPSVSHLKQMLEKEYEAFQRSLRFRSVVPGRKPAWMKKEEEWSYAIEQIAIATGARFHTIQSAFKKASLMYSLPSVPAIHRNIFRDFYFCVVKKYDIYPRDNIFDAFNRHDQYGHQRGANVNCFF